MTPFRLITENVAFCHTWSAKLLDVMQNVTTLPVPEEYQDVLVHFHHTLGAVSEFFEKAQEEHGEIQFDSTIRGLIDACYFSFKRQKDTFHAIDDDADADDWFQRQLNSAAGGVLLSKDVMALEAATLRATDEVLAEAIMASKGTKCLQINERNVSDKKRVLERLSTLANQAIHSSRFFAHRVGNCQENASKYTTELSNLRSVLFKQISDGTAEADPWPSNPPTLSSSDPKEIIIVHYGRTVKDAINAAKKSMTGGVSAHTDEVVRILLDKEVNAIERKCEPLRSKKGFVVRRLEKVGYKYGKASTARTKHAWFSKRKSSSDDRVFESATKTIETVIELATTLFDLAQKNLVHVAAGACFLGGSMEPANSKLLEKTMDLEKVVDEQHRQKNGPSFAYHRQMARDKMQKILDATSKQHTLLRVMQDWQEVLLAILKATNRIASSPCKDATISEASRKQSGEAS